MALSLAPLFMGDTLQVFCLSHWKLTNTQAPQLCVFSAWSRLDLGSISMNLAGVACDGVSVTLCHRCI